MCKFISQRLSLCSPHLSEHDHNLRKTREFLSAKRNKPNLSGVLREAKDRAEEEAEQEKENEEARKAHFGTLFDDYQGECVTSFCLLFIEK